MNITVIQNNTVKHSPKVGDIFQRVDDTSKLYLVTQFYDQKGHVRFMLVSLNSGLSYTDSVYKIDDIFFGKFAHLFQPVSNITITID